MLLENGMRLAFDEGNIVGITKLIEGKLYLVMVTVNSLRGLEVVVNAYSGLTNELFIAEATSFKDCMEYDIAKNFGLEHNEAPANNAPYVSYPIG